MPSSSVSTLSEWLLSSPDVYGIKEEKKMSYKRLKVKVIDFRNKHLGSWIYYGRIRIFEIDKFEPA